MYHEDQRAETWGIKPTETDKGDDRTTYICPALISSTRISFSSMLKDGNKSRTRHKRKLTFKVHQEVPKGLNKHWAEKTNSQQQANKAGELEPTLCICGSNLLGRFQLAVGANVCHTLLPVRTAWTASSYQPELDEQLRKWIDGWTYGIY